MTKTIDGILRRWDKIGEIVKMTKHDPEELNEVREEIDGILRAHRDLLNDEPRVLTPLTQARDSAKTKYEDLTVTHGRG